LEKIVKQYIYNFVIYFRSEQTKNISQDFISFFNTYFFKKEIFTEEIDLNLRFYVSILQSYMNYLYAHNNLDKELVNEWQNNISPFLYQKYPFEQKGIFNLNADIKYLIEEIDTLIKKQNKLNNNNIYVKKTIRKDSNINKNKEKGKTNDKTKKKEEDDLSPLKINNLNIEEELEKEENINIIKLNKIEDNNINMKVIKSSSIASKSTSVSIYDELNKKHSIKKNYDTEINNKPRSFIINQEINPNFADEFETERITIVHKKKEKIIISKMTFNLFLKKIVIHNFYNENIIYATNFSEQCFYFIKKEIVFKKIINCFQYYTQLKVPFNQRRNLIYFMNLLVIKMYNHYVKINTKDEIILLIKEFYNNVISEIKSIAYPSKKPTVIIQNFFVEGINAIKQGVNTINRNIMGGVEKMKNIKNNNTEPNNKINNIEKEDTKHRKTENINNQNIVNNKDDKDINDCKEKEIIRAENLLKECEKIISLFKTDQHKIEVLTKLEKTLYIFELKVKFKIKIYSGKFNEKKKLAKSYSERSLPIYNFSEKKSKNKLATKKNYFYCLEWDTSDIGEELIYASQSALNKIKRKELYNGAFTKKTKSNTCPGIMENIDKFNKLIFFIIEDILSYDLPSTRAKVIEKWATVAEYCRRRKDYNDIFVINSVFKNYIISNLTLTWKEIGNKTIKLIKDLDNFCSIEGNYKNIREDMKSLSRNDFYTPYLGLLLKDLNFFEENYKYLDGGNLINFDKINGIQSAIDLFFHFQKTVDKKVTMLQEDLNFFENLENIKEVDLDNLAQKLEPKFILYSSPKNEKRLTSIDIKYFSGHLTKTKSNNIIDNAK
jgi:hypothetical protein